MASARSLKTSIPPPEEAQARSTVIETSKAPTGPILWCASLVQHLSLSFPCFPLLLALAKERKDLFGGWQNYLFSFLFIYLEH